MQPVTLTISQNACTISNGILTMLWKEDGTLGSLVRNGVELVCNLPERSDTAGRTAFYVDYHAEGAFRKYQHPALKVVENTDKRAHIAFVDKSGYLAIEYHIILMQGESGYYAYVIGANNTDVAFELSEFRIVYRSGSRVFDHACNNERMGLQPTHKYMEQYEKLQDETFRLPDGEKYSNGDVYSKYDYAGYFSQNPVWGQYGHGYGFFLIPVSTEYYPGGPMKQELLVHYDGILLNYFTGAHFGTGNLHVPVGWKKFYGPFYQYFNEGDDEKQLYQDALQEAKRQKALWPFAWVDDPLYPLVRSTVTGRLVFADGMPCAGATVILGKGGLPVECQSADYLYDTTTDENGCFTLDHVRFDTYCLYAYQTGGSNTEQLQTPCFEIREEKQSLGEIRWNLKPQRLLCQLGRATRTSEGYRYAGELRNFKWMDMVPETVDFKIGVNDEATDWYYAQTKPGSWYLRFDLDEAPAAPCRLIVALAGASSGTLAVDRKDIRPGVPIPPAIPGRGLPTLTVRLNGQVLGTEVLVNDSAVYRSATLSGRYRRFVFEVNPDMLRSGENVVELHNMGARIMYDTIVITEELSL